VDNKENKGCCDMRAKVVLGIAKVLSKEECGIDDSALVDFHNFDYTSESKLPVAAALTTKFCAWCGTERRPDDVRRTAEVIRPHRDN